MPNCDPLLWVQSNTLLAKRLERDQENIENQRLDERKTKDQKKLNRFSGARVSSHTFTR